MVHVNTAAPRITMKSEVRGRVLLESSVIGIEIIRPRIGGQEWIRMVQNTNGIAGCKLSNTGNSWFTCDSLFNSKWWGSSTDSAQVGSAYSTLD
jgi:hypothetical protein